MEGGQAGLVCLVSICLCAPCPSQQQVSWLGFSFPPCLLCFLDLSWLHRSVHPGQGPAQGGAAGTGRASRDRGTKSRAAARPRAAGQPSAGVHQGRSGPLRSHPRVGAWWAQPRLCGLSPGEKLRSQSGQLETGRSVLRGRGCQIPRVLQGDTQGDTWGDTQCLPGDTQGDTWGLQGDTWGLQGDTRGAYRVTPGAYRVTHEAPTG